jgi:hypothetical protein
MLTVVLNDDASLFETLEEYDDNFGLGDHMQIVYDFGGTIVDCHIDDVTEKRGVIQHESH